jgi:hypothetical protein
LALQEETDVTYQSVVPIGQLKEKAELLADFQFGTFFPAVLSGASCSMRIF